MTATGRLENARYGVTATARLESSRHGVWNGVEHGYCTGDVTSIINEM